MVAVSVAVAVLAIGLTITGTQYRAELHKERDGIRSALAAQVSKVRKAGACG